MGFVGSEPSAASVSSAGILDGAIVDADINASAAIAISKTAFSAGTGVTLSTNTLNIDAAQTGITSLLVADIKIGEDNETKIDFEDVNKINFYANNAKEVELAENSLSPGTSDGTALGTTSLMWSDLFIADGGVINFNNGDVTLTHSSNTLTIGGGNLAATISTASQPNITTLAGLTTIGAVANALAMTFSDVTLFHDANNADTSFSIGTSATEALKIEVLNGGSNKTAEEVHFSTATASGTANHGKMVFDVDGSDIVTIDDSGLAATITTASQPNVTTLAGLTTIGAVSNALAMTFSDVTLFHDANNADTSLSIGTSATEALKIEVLNGGSNKTAEAVHFSTATASGTADHGSMVFDIDGTDILTIDDGGLVIKTTGTIGPVGDEDLLTLTASGSLVTVAGEISVTTLDIGGTNVGSTAAEINLLDGSAKSTASITIADTDAFIIIDGTTTKQIPASDIAAYAGGGGGSFEATANGAISAGDRVALRSDGDVEKCEALQAGKLFGTAASTNATEFETGTTYYQSCNFDPDNNKIGITYRDAGNSNYPTIALGHITNAVNATVAIGTPVVVESVASSNDFKNMPYDTAADRFVSIYSTSAGIRAVVWTVNDAASNTITKGSAQAIDNSNKESKAVYDTNAGRVVAMFDDADDSNISKAVAFTVRGGGNNDVQDIGALFDIAGIQVTAKTIVYDDNDNKVNVFYANSGDSDYPYVVALTVDNSDNSITKGTAVRLTNETAVYGLDRFPAIHDSVANANIAINESATGDDIESWVWTCSSGVITAGGHSVDETIPSGHVMGNYGDGIFDPDTGKIIYFAAQSGIFVLVGSISGTGADAVFTNESVTRIHAPNGVTGGGNVEYLRAFYDTNSNKSGFVFKNTSGDTGNFMLIPVIPKNATNFIGFSNDAVSNDATATITTTGGVATGQSSLTIGSEYYVDSLGALTTTSGTVFAGKALTATTLLVNPPRINNTD